MTKNQRLLYGLLIILVVPIIAVISGTVGFWFQLDPTDKTYLLTLIDHNKIYIFFSILIFLVVLGYIAKWILLSYFIPLQKMTEDIEILKNSNRLYTIKTKGSRELKKLADVLSRHASELEEVRSNIDEKIKQAKNDLDEEKNILASLVSELKDGIIICNNEGQIVLFNHHALILMQDKNQDSDSFQSKVGIGRSIYKLLPKEIIKHALDEIEYKKAHKNSNPYAQFVYALPSLVSARIRIVPVFKGTENIGFILLLHDVTAELEKDLNRYEMMESMVNTMRSSVGNIRAAIETITAYKDMQEEQRDRFNAIIVDEAARITMHLNETINHYKDYFSLNWPLEQIQGKSLLNLIIRNAKQSSELNLSSTECSEKIWVSVENFSFVNLIIFLFKELREKASNESISLRMTDDTNFVHLDIIWRGDAVSNNQFDEWLNLPINLAEIVLPYTVNEVIQRHNARIWQKQGKDGSNKIRVLLKSVTTVNNVDLTKNVTYGARPEFYDFDLFSHSPLLEKWEDESLSKLRFVIFDFETSGLNPSAGDEIISMGAVRIVNGRILSEHYEQLVDPGLKIKKMTTEITGITTEMLQGKPTIDKVLPVFHAYCEDAVLVAHNAAFDMRFIQLKEKQVGLTFNHPVLDTLLLSAFVHANQESHSLDAIAERFGLKNDGRHTALGDAKVTAEIFLKLLPMLAEKGIYTLDQAYKASQKTYYARIKY